ncbi:uncharacterized protein LOC128728975 [Anopheles nili]|uniref:uncharacterized protein LOC128728975 n=1 Tax=Anopheles nili TaxID=185578 RepID=UPI00237A34F4|nr:uncharacterized protein LOC128728975 [Anopheles nili]
MAANAPADQHLSPAPNAGPERPLSFYDNLTSTGTGSGTGRVIQFPDIQFRFDETIPDRRSVHSSAKSDFFGLNSPLVLAPEPDPAGGPPPTPARTPPTRSGAAIAPYPEGSPSSSASTVPLRTPSASPSIVDAGLMVGEPGTGGATSTPRSSRPNSTIKTITIKLPDSSCPSEAVYMTTTVPQNFAKNSATLIGRHKPTRSSLRHSRMLVVNRTVPVRHPPGNALNLRHLRLSRIVMVLQILVGLALNLIGLGIVVWSPSTSTKDNPYWSGLILILCGALFLALFEFKRGRTGTDKTGQPGSRLHQPVSTWRENCFHFLHVNALIVLLLTIFFTMLAFIYALIHSANLSAEGLRCEPQFTFNVNSSTCVCTIDTRPARMVPNTGESSQANETSSFMSGGLPNGDDSRLPEGVIRLEYRDFNCNEVHSLWYYVMISSALLNCAGCLLAATFLVIYSVECMRRSERLPYRAKNGQLGERMVASVPAQGSSAKRPASGVPDATAMPLLAATGSQASKQRGVGEAPDTSILSSASGKTEPGDNQTLSNENNTMTTILPEEDEGLIGA